MATADDMKKNMLDFYDGYKDLLTMAGIKESQFVYWLKKFVTYDEIRKAHRFIFGESDKGVWSINSLNRWVVMAQEIFKWRDTQTWKRMIRDLKNEHDVVNMRFAFHNIRIHWSQRPKTTKEVSDKEISNDASD